MVTSPGAQTSAFCRLAFSGAVRLLSRVSLLWHDVCAADLFLVVEEFVGISVPAVRDASVGDTVVGIVFAVTGSWCGVMVVSWTTIGSV